jgi:hypothetical protein
MSLCFRAADSAVRVHLDCSVESELLAAAAPPLDDLRIMPEGDVLLF